MTYVLRPATPEERQATVAQAWRGLLSISMGRGKGRQVVEPDADARVQLVNLPGVAVGRRWLRDVLGAAVLEALEDATVMVAEHPEAPGLALGWVAWKTEPATLLALHVEAKRRGAWVGRTLLQHALGVLGADVPSALMTEAGRRLLGHVRAKAVAA